MPPWSTCQLGKKILIFYNKYRKQQRRDVNIVANRHQKVVLQSNSWSSSSSTCLTCQFFANQLRLRFNKASSGCGSNKPPSSFQSAKKSYVIKKSDKKLNLDEIPKMIATVRMPAEALKLHFPACQIANLSS